MKGIISYGAYVPNNRLQRKKIGEFFGSRSMVGEKAVAGFDEDSVSMGVEAALNCLNGIHQTDIGMVYFATTSAPYKEKGSIATITKALNLSEQVVGIEATSSLRSGTSSIIAANGLEKTLIIASDCRTGAPNGQNEQLFGDGAACFLIGSGDDVIANLVDAISVQDDIVSQWRNESDRFTYNWEERFGSSAFTRLIKDTIAPFLEKNNCKQDSLAKVIVSAPGKGAPSQVAKLLRLEPKQIQASLIDNIGATGTADAFMMLAAALEDAKPKNQLLVVSFAEGIDVLLFEVTEEIKRFGKRKGVQCYLNKRSKEISYSEYLKWRELLSTEPARRPETGRPSAPAMRRGYNQNLGFIGSKCCHCGTAHFPKQRICVECQAEDEMEDYRFVGQSAKVATYTVDYLSSSPDNPMLVAVIDFADGGRIISEITDCKPDEIKIGMEVEMTFRRLYVAGGISNYYWKARAKW